MKRNLKRFFAIMLVGVISMSLIGCGANTNNSASTKDSGEAATDKISMKISHHPYMHALPSVYAEQNGLYDEFDYTMDMYSNGPVQNESIASGAWEVGTTGIAGAMLGIIGYDMKVLGLIYEEASVMDLWVRPDSPLANLPVGENGVPGTAEDWKGKTVLCAKGTNVHLVLIAALQALGLNESDVTIIDTQVSSSYSAFKAGEADITAIWAPYSYLAEKEGWVNIVSASDLGISLPTVIVATKKAVDERPEAVQAWLNTFLESMEGIQGDLENSIVMLADFEEEQGIAMSLEDAKSDFENRPFYTLEENKEYFTENADGVTKAEEVMMFFTDFMVSQGKISAEERQKMLDSDFIVTDFMQNATY